MKYLTIAIALLTTTAMGQSVSLTASGKSNQAEINFLTGDEVSLGIISTIQDNKHAISLTYHPVTINTIIDVTPFVRVSNGVSIEPKARKMYSYDYGIDVGFVRLVRSNIVVSGYQAYSSWQFGINLRL